MILAMFLKPIFVILQGGLSVIKPEDNNLPTWIDECFALLTKALMFFPVDVWVITIANIIFWLSIQYGWAVLEWIYKKIPGVN